MVQTADMIQTPRILEKALLVDRGRAEIPLTITLYLSMAIITMLQMEAQPKRDPNIPYSSHMNGPVQVYNPAHLAATFMEYAQLVLPVTR